MTFGSGHEKKPVYFLCEAVCIYDGESEVVFVIIVCDVVVIKHRGRGRVRVNE